MQLRTTEKGIIISRPVTTTIGKVCVKRPVDGSTNEPVSSRSEPYIFGVHNSRAQAPGGPDADFRQDTLIRMNHLVTGDA